MINKDLTPAEVASLIDETGADPGPRQVLPISNKTQPRQSSPQSGSPQSGSALASTTSTPEPSATSLNATAGPASANEPVELSTPPSMVAAFQRCLQRWVMESQESFRALPSCGTVRTEVANWPTVRQEFSHPLCLRIYQAGHQFALLKVDRKLLFAMIDRLLGGGQYAVPVVRRPLTEIEIALFGRSTDALIQALAGELSGAASANTIRVETDLDRIPNEAAEAIVVLEADVELGETSGTIAWMMTPNVAQSFGATKTEVDEVAMALPAEGLSVVAATIHLRADQAEQLSVGDTILAKTNSRPRIYVDRKKMYSCRLGTHEGNKAVIVDEPVVDKSVVDSPAIDSPSD